jgi:hypothetical protein
MSKAEEILRPEDWVKTYADYLYSLALIKVSNIETAEEGKISISESVKLFYHLLYCSYCWQFVKQLSIIDHISKGVANSIFTHPPHTLSATIKEDIQQQIDNPCQ